MKDCLLSLLMVVLVAGYTWAGETGNEDGDVIVGLFVTQKVEPSKPAEGEEDAFCFSDEFLRRLEADSTINIASRLGVVNEDLDDVQNMTVLLMTGQGEFALTEEHLKLLRGFVMNGGVILAGPSCADEQWAESFHRLMMQLTGMEDGGLQPLHNEHVLFSILYELPRLRTVRANRRVTIEGVEVDGRLGVVYSPVGLNDTAYADVDCCCCKGDEIRDSWRLIANVVAYSLTH